MTYGGPEFIKMIQKNNKITYIFLLVLAGGKINRPGQLDSKITRVGGKISRDSLPPGGQAVQGGKINCYTRPNLIHEKQLR